MRYGTHMQVTGIVTCIAGYIPAMHVTELLHCSKATEVFSKTHEFIYT